MAFPMADLVCRGPAAGKYERKMFDNGNNLFYSGI